MENKRLTASQACKIADQLNKNIDSILAQIQAEANKQKKVLHLYYIVSEQDQKELRDIGYQVQSHSDRDGELTTIIWNRTKITG